MIGFAEAYEGLYYLRLNDLRRRLNDLRMCMLLLLRVQPENVLQKIYFSTKSSIL
jgi:hypothetical protein